MALALIPRLLKLLGSLRNLWWRWTVPIVLRGHGVRMLGSIVAHGWPIVARAPSTEITIGRRVALCSRSSYTALGVAHQVILRTLEPGARIVVGDDSGLSGTVICAALSVEIGQQCLIGADVRIFDTDFHPVAPERRRFNDDPACVATAPVRIGNNVFIGVGAIICKGVTIGDNAVIGAGSVVTRDIPAGAVAGGNPANIISYIAARD